MHPSLGATAPVGLRVAGYNFQGCKIPLAHWHLRVKCYAGRVKVLTTCVVLFQFLHLREKLGNEGRVIYLEILHP